jgi:hypothetical protein
VQASAAVDGAVDVGVPDNAVLVAGCAAVQRPSHLRVLQRPRWRSPAELAGEGRGDEIFEWNTVVAAGRGCDGDVSVGESDVERWNVSELGRAGTFREPVAFDAFGGVPCLPVLVAAFDLPGELHFEGDASAVPFGENVSYPAAVVGGYFCSSVPSEGGRCRDDRRFRAEMVCGFAFVLGVAPNGVLEELRAEVGGLRVRVGAAGEDRPGCSAVVCSPAVSGNGRCDDLFAVHYRCQWHRSPPLHPVSVRIVANLTDTGSGRY